MRPSSPMRSIVVALALLCGCASVGGSPQAFDVARSDTDDAPPATLDVGFDAGFDASPDAPGLDAAVDRGAPDDRPDVALLVDVPTADRAAPIDAGGAPDAAAARTTLRVHYPAGARSLSLRGDLASLSWDRGVSLSHLAGDVWEWSSTGVASAFEWKPLLDDRDWSLGPNYRATPGATLDIYPRFVNRSGRWSRAITAFHSTLLANDRGVWIYVPPSYDENPLARYPVVYMHDGQNLFNPATAFGGQPWYAQDAMNQGAESGAIREAIVVGVENTAARIDEYTPTRDATRMAGGRGALYLRMLVEEVKPLIDRTYRTLPGREDTVLVGSSLGGLISAYAGVHQAAVFGHVGAMSPSTWWDGRMILREVATLAASPTRPLRFYVDSGDSGDSNDGVTDTAALVDALRGVGYREGVDLRYVVQRGAAHNELYWSQRLPGALAFLLGRRDP
ncbi:MAG: esterase family protein [Myxococcaceae bacterium]|nr:esterase family protein [Myxococcaceae bacterium]